MKWLDKILETNLNAVLVTVLIHLVILFIFLLVQLQPPKQQVEAVIIMDPENLEEMEKFFEAQEEVDKRMEELAQARNLSLDDIRNLASNNLPPDHAWESESQKLSAEELQKQYEDELRREMYGEDYEEINQRLNEEVEREEYDYSPGASDSDEQKQGNQEYYSGPALVKVELEDQNRGHVYIDIPVFVCRGTGIIVVSIEINEYGQVKKAQINSASASIDEDCMKEEAMRAAKSSIFSINQGKKTSKGTITYQFIEQN